MNPAPPVTIEVGMAVSFRSIYGCVEIRFSVAVLQRFIRGEKLGRRRPQVKNNTRAVSPQGFAIVLLEVQLKFRIRLQPPNRCVWKDQKAGSFFSQVLDVLDRFRAIAWIVTGVRTTFILRKMPRLSTAHVKQLGVAASGYGNHRAFGDSLGDCFLDFFYQVPVLAGPHEVGNFNWIGSVTLRRLCQYEVDCVEQSLPHELAAMSGEHMLAALA